MDVLRKMCKKAGNRLAHLLLILTGIFVVNFILFYVVGGDPVLRALGRHADTSLAEELRREWGLYGPLWRQFLSYVASVVTFDFGRSYTTSQSVGGMIFRALPNTLIVTLPAFLLSNVLSLAASVFTTAFGMRKTDTLLRVAGDVGLGVSLIFAAVAAQYIFAFKLGWFPVESGYVLPVLVLTAVMLPADFLFYRAVVQSEASKAYLTTAAAKGGGGVRTALFHLLPACSSQIAVRIAAVVPYMIVGSVILEDLFSIPGMGALLVNAFHNSDWPVMRAVTWLFTLVFVVMNELGDAVATALDPRVREDF